MANAAGRRTSALTTLLLLNARVHGFASVAIWLATRGYGDVPCGYQASAFEYASYNVFRYTLSITLCFPSIVEPIARLSETVRWLPGSLNTWIGIALVIWVDFLVWGILLALMFGLARRLRIFCFRLSTCSLTYAEADGRSIELFAAPPQTLI